MKTFSLLSRVALLATMFAMISPAAAKSLTGKVTDPKGSPMSGVMVSAFDEKHRKWISVFSQEDGSFTLDGLRDVEHQVRARLMG